LGRDWLFALECLPRTYPSPFGSGRDPGTVPREIPPPAGESAGVRNDAVQIVVKRFKLNAYRGVEALRHPKASRAGGRKQVPHRSFGAVRNDIWGGALDAALKRRSSTVPGAGDVETGGTLPCFWQALP
jgi:hypothetical protein